MPRKVFYSFHYKPDNWRVAKVRNIGAIEGNKVATDNEWETITNGGENAIKRWIDDQMIGKSCVVVLVGSETADRKWVKHEIVEGWKKGKGVLAIHIHNITDRYENQTSKGKNPLDYIKFDDGTKLSSVAKAYDPPRSSSQGVYSYISEHIEQWIEDAIEIRKNY
jgi:hypothetical protein